MGSPWEIRKRLLITISLAMLIAGGAGLIFLVAVQYRVETETSTLVETIVPPAGAVSLSNAYITEGDEFRIFVYRTSSGSGPMELRVLQPDGEILLQEMFVDRALYYPVAKTGGSHTLIITNMGSAAAEIAGTLRVPLTAWLDLDLFNNIDFIVGAVPFAIFGIALYHERKSGRKVRYVWVVVILAVALLGWRLLYWDFSSYRVNTWHYILYSISAIVIVRMFREKQAGQIKINILDSTGRPMHGYWTALLQDGREVKSELSPAVFDVQIGQTYQVYVGDYGSHVFDHWSDGNADRYRNAVAGDTLTAVYKG